MSDAAAEPGATFWWIRHAPTAWPPDHPPGFCGWSDPDARLDPVALEALRSLLPPQATSYSSPLRRTAMTAEALGLTQVTWEPLLREQHFGVLEGMPYDAAPLELWDDLAGFRPGGGESFTDLIERVTSAVEGMTASHTGEVVVVAHAGVIRAAVALALGLSPATALRLVIDPLSMTRLRWLGRAHGWAVLSVNASATALR